MSSPRPANQFCCLSLSQVDNELSANHIPPRVRRAGSSLDAGRGPVSQLSYPVSMIHSNLQAEKRCMLDLLAVPKHPYAAMENWGLSVFVEQKILLDAEVSSSSYQMELTMVVVHEICHQTKQQAGCLISQVTRRQQLVLEHLS
ncbi:Thyrotropin-releasing hormone-degrading ectoenzyme [Collichthys lucidus]|uniref:Thyrotropin-releasing hormone-degrading ectoenzyme n=1 Tax=Collichthys lucidus TaxID=240159 RepID=A0A4U5VPH0_COLLU|nr:Thyrotropin-releasing hormone-degrading ectoenzyme [Collichthys lucidus]